MENLADYRKWYEKGWRYSQRETANLDFVPRGISTFSAEYDAWLDGYLDLAVGRTKWHMLNCENHGGSAQPGTCGEG